MTRYVGIMLVAALAFLAGCETECNCGETQICQDGKCLNGGFLTPCGNNAAACNAEAGYVCVGGPQYLDQGTFEAKVDTDKRLVMNGDKPVFVTTVSIPASTYFDAYCSKSGCSSDDDCPDQTYCVGVNTIDEEAGANSRVVKVCLKREYCAPAKTFEDCYPVANRSFVQTDDDGSGYCTKTCSSSSCPADQKCVKGRCQPASGSCPGEGKFCSSCMSNDDCATENGTCVYEINGGARFCSKSCTCADNENFSITADCEPGTRTDDPLVFRCVAFCAAGNSGCPEAAPSGLPVRCVTRAEAKFTDSKRTALARQPTLIENYNSQCLVSPKDQSSSNVACHVIKR